MFNIKIKRKSLRKLAKLDEKRKRRIKRMVLILKTNPIPFRRVNVCKLKGYDNTYRIRVGNLRIVYEVLWTKRTIIIHYIGQRKKAYK